MHNKFALFCGFALVSHQCLAAPNDLFLQAKDLNSTSNTALKVTISADAVNDTLDVFDIRKSEGVTDQSAGDYQGFNIAALYRFTPNWAVEASFWQREIEYTQDTNKLQSALLGVRFTPQLSLQPSSGLTFRGSIWANRADALSKTSPTRVNQHTFNQVNVENPEDLQIQLDAIFSKKLDHMNQLNAFASAGYSKVKVNAVNIQAKQQGCLMNIAIDSSNQYFGNLAQPCLSGNITLTDLYVQGNANEYGLDIQQDLNYDSYFASLGGSWNWRYAKFESQLAYQYQYLWRDAIDDRVKNFGNQSIRDNHSLGLKLSYDIYPKITGFLKGEMYQHNFVGQIPFLYNGITASRLDKRYGIASIGLNFHGF